MSVKEQIENLIKEKPKHFAKMIKTRHQLLEWVNENSLVESDNMSEMIYSALNQVDNTCPRGNVYIFNNINDGYKFCGKAGKCECARESVSNTIKRTLSSRTKEQKEATNIKRKQTNLEKYGVEHVCQTKENIKKHREIYADKEKTRELVEKVQKTKLEKYGTKGYNNPIKIKETWKRKNLNHWNDYPDVDIDELHDFNTLYDIYNSNTIAKMARKLNVSNQSIYKWIKKHHATEPFKNQLKNEMLEFLNEIGIKNIIKNTKNITTSKHEIDFYLPDYKLAIEMNGIYWNHENMDHVHRSYHKQKFNQCEASGIQLLTIFSNHWTHKQNIIKQIIKNKLNLDNDSIYARDTIIRKIQARDTRKILDNHHIQGYTPASICYGLFHDNKLVSIMTFSKSRIAIGKPEAGYELVRYASTKRVVGAASKLLARFRKDYPNEIVFSYSNNDLSNGNLYKTIGFILERETDSSYWYIHPEHKEKLLHRFNFSKQKLVEKGHSSNKTERQITQEMGLLKLWDCGKKDGY